MLYAEAPVALAIFSDYLFVDRKNQVICAIANGVNHHLQSGAVSFAHAIEHCTIRKHLFAGEPARVGRVFVRLKEEGRSRSEAAIGKSLQAADAQHSAAEMCPYPCPRQSLPGRQR